MQTDLEEAKAQEIAKLQESLHDMQLQVEEAKAMVVKEREAAKKAIEEAPPVIKETPVLVEDTEKINSLTAEVEQLKVADLSFGDFSLTTTLASAFLWISLDAYHMNKSIEYLLIISVLQFVKYSDEIRLNLMMLGACNLNMC